jgi:putative transposase
VRAALRDAIEHVRKSRPITIDAWVLLPDHLHCIWTLPPGDDNYSTRWSLIKRRVSFACSAEYKRGEWLTASKAKHRESTFWQRRFWEHQIRDEEDYMRHVDYLHYNPVKHGLCDRVADWRYSTFHRFVA